MKIDGSQHDPIEDATRDNHLAKFGIETVRIGVSDLEAENNSFISCIVRIRDRIELALSRQNERKEQEPTFISLTDYKEAFENGVDLESPYLKATAIIRFQLLILELLENGHLRFDTPWQFEIIERDVQNFAQLAKNQTSSEYQWCSSYDGSNYSCDPFTSSNTKVYNFYPGSTYRYLRVTVEDDQGATATAFKTVYIENMQFSQTQKTETKAARIGDDQLSIYPNPVKGLTEVEFRMENKGDVVLSITNLEGKVIREYQYRDQLARINRKELDLSFLSQGIYLVKVTIGDQHKTLRIIRE